LGRDLMAKMRIVGIIQARMGSTRLQGKTMMRILGKPILWHVVMRNSKSRYMNKVVVATTKNPEDDVISEFCKELEIAVFRGSEEDVLDRYYKCAKEFAADVVVRMTADDPLNDSAVIDRIIKTFMDQSPSIDYASNDVNFTYPVGVGAQVFSFGVLERLWKEVDDDLEREHVVLHILNNKQNFSIQGVENEEDYSNYRWTLDYLEDFKFIENIYEHFKDESFTMKDVIGYLESNPEVVKINEIHDYIFKEKVVK
jgi:spore coat polysaccharide biosynthesis protein SpsF